MTEVLGKCSIKGCPKTARWQLGFRVWPHGIRNRQESNAVEGATNTWVCDEHAIRNPDEFFTGHTKEQLVLQFLKHGRGMPDLSTAQIVHTEIGDGPEISVSDAAKLGGVPSSVTR
jgi:hypothetical protein